MSFDLTNQNISDTFQNVLQRTGSDNSLYDLEGNKVGDLRISGSLYAQEYVVTSSVTNITTQQLSGSTKFGDTQDDKHQFTGSLDSSGSIYVGDKLYLNAGTQLTADYITNNSAIGPLQNQMDFYLNAAQKFSIGSQTTTFMNFSKLKIDDAELEVDGNITAGVITASGDISASGNIIGGIISASSVVSSIAGSYLTTGITSGNVTGIEASHDLFIESGDDIFFKAGSSGDILIDIDGDNKHFKMMGPSALLTVEGNLSASGDLYLNGNDIYNDMNRKINFGNHISFYASNGRTNYYNTGTSIASGDTYGILNFVNYDNQEDTAQIRIVATENHTETDNGGSKYEFLAMPNATDASDDANFHTIATLDPNGTSGHLNVNGDISSSGNLFVGDVGGNFVSWSKGGTFQINMDDNSSNESVFKVSVDDVGQFEIDEDGDISASGNLKVVGSGNSIYSLGDGYYYGTDSNNDTSIQITDVINFRVNPPDDFDTNILVKFTEDMLTLGGGPQYPNVKIAGTGSHGATMFLHAESRKVGINTLTGSLDDTSPPKELTVSGSISASGDLYIGKTGGGYISASNGNLEINGIGSAELEIAGNITASGNISSSGTIFASRYKTDNGQFIDSSGGNIGFSSGIVVSQITASGDISSSGDFYGYSYRSNGKHIATNTGTLISLTDSSLPVVINASYLTIGSNITSSGNITADGNISSSGTIVGSNLSGTNTGDQNITNLAVTGSDVTFNHITASGDISASGIIVSSLTAGDNLDIGSHNFRAQDITADGGDVIIGDASDESILLSNYAAGFLSVGQGDDVSTKYLTVGNNGVSIPQNGLDITGDLEVSSHITTSGEISASGALYSPILYGSAGSNPEAIASHKPLGANIQIYGVDTIPNRYQGTGHYFDNHITASGNISASGDIYLEDNHYLRNTSNGANIQLLNSSVKVKSGHFITQNSASINTTADSGKALTVEGDISASGALFGKLGDGVIVSSSASDTTLFSVKHPISGSVFEVNAAPAGSGSLALSGSLLLNNNSQIPTDSGSRLYNKDGYLTWGGTSTINKPTLISPTIHTEMSTYSYNGNSKVYIPFGIDWESTAITSTYTRTAFSYSGRLLSVKILSSQVSNETVVSFQKNESGTIIESTMVDITAVDTPYTAYFSSSAFDADEKLHIGIDVETSNNHVHNVISTWQLDVVQDWPTQV